MKSNLYTYNNETFNSNSLRYVHNSFVENFIHSIQTNSKAVFLSIWDVKKQEITYEELGRHVLGTAAYLLEEHSDSEVIVLASFNSYEFIVYILATLVSGKTLYLLDPRETTEFYEKATKEMVKTHSFIRNLEIKNNSYADIKKLKENINRDKDFIYIRTSGSTGKSKIVRQTQIGVLANVEALIRHHELFNCKKNIATSLPLFHVNALEFSLFSCLFTGSKLVLWNYTQIQNLGKLIDGEDIRILSMIPTQILQMLKYKNWIPRTSFKKIDYIVSAAAPLTTALVKQVQDEIGVKIIQGYGLSEAVNFSCTMPIKQDLDLYRKISIDSPYPSIGVPLWGNEVHVLSEDGRLLGENEKGELSISGYNLMSGYLGEQTLNEQKLSYFRTGDLGFHQYHENKKYFFIVGRIKDVAKRNGETVALRDVDDCFSVYLNEGVDCISVAFPHDLRGEEIGLLCNGDAAFVNSDRFKNLINSLPLHRRPKVVFYNSDFQLRTASGKPMRWKYVELFSSYKNVQLGNRVEYLESKNQIEKCKN